MTGHARDTPHAGAKVPTKLAVVVLFTVYLVLLAWIVLWKLGVPWAGGISRVIKLVPFVPSGDEGASAPFEVVANFALFIPLGVYPVSYTHLTLPTN